MSITNMLGNSGGGTGGFSASPSFSPYSAIGSAADAIGGFLPQRPEYSGDKGALTSGLDSAYDKVSDAMMNIPVWGLIAGMAMKAGGLVNKALGAIGGGTDGETTADALLGSNFGFALTGGLNALNGLLGDDTDTIAKDYKTLAAVGSSYSGTYQNIDDAVAHSGKRYGIVSKNSMLKENALIHQAGRLLNLLTTMANNTLMANQVNVNLGSLASNAFSQNMQGGYNLSAVRAAKQGAKLFSKELLDRTTMVLSKSKKGSTIEFTPFIFKLGGVTKYKKGGKYDLIKSIEKLRKLTDSYEKFINYLRENENRAESDDYDLQAFYLSKDTFTDEEGDKVTPYEEWLKTEAKEPGNGHMTDQFKLPWHITYGGDNGDNWKLDEDGEWTYSVPEGHSDKNGKEYTIEDYIRYFSDPEGLRSHFIYKGLKYDGAKLLPNIIKTPTDVYAEEFKEGGLLNVIPEGALHAHKHHMEDTTPELDGQITKKGIPVIIEGEKSGEVELQAEIEKNEIIFNKEVTQKIEELAKKYHDYELSLTEKDEVAIEAGKLIAQEIMENTDDRTGLIKEVQ